MCSTYTHTQVTQRSSQTSMVCVNVTMLINSSYIYIYKIIYIDLPDTLLGTSVHQVIRAIIQSASHGTSFSSENEYEENLISVIPSLG